jgi:hypothetical protein
MKQNALRAIALSAVAALAYGCAWQSGEVGEATEGPQAPLAQRRATVVAETCLLTPGQLNALSPASAVARQIVLICAQAADSGELNLLGGATPQSIGEQMKVLRGMGLQPRLGVTYGAGPGMPGDPKQASARLADAAWRASVVQSLSALDCDGFEVAWPQLEGSSKDNLTAFVAELSAKAPQNRAVGVFAPPSMTEPSDLPGGDAYDLAALRPYVDRVRLMTLDYSCCGAPPGPTLEPSWAATVAWLAGSKIPETMLDVSVPLYGVHFTAGGLQYISYPEALGLSERNQVQVRRNDWETPYFTFDDAAGAHAVWFDDRISILAYLRRWNPPELRASVGLVFYGLGAEDFGLWSSLQESRR